MSILHWFSRVIVHVWHFLYVQIQMTTWFGNIVAGVVTFITLTLVWPKFRKAFERASGISALHDKLDQQHRERLRQASHHHQVSVALAKSHHAALLAAVVPPTPTRPSVIVKKATTPVAKKATAPVKKVVK